MSLLFASTQRALQQVLNAPDAQSAVVVKSQFFLEEFRYFCKV